MNGNLSHSDEMALERVMFRGSKSRLPRDVDEETQSNNSVLVWAQKFVNEMKLSRFLLSQA